MADFWRTFHHDGKIIPGCARPSPTTFTIAYEVDVYYPAEWADTLTLFHLYQYMYSVCVTEVTHHYQIALGKRTAK